MHSAMSSYKLLIAHARIPSAFARHPVLLPQLFCNAMLFASTFKRHIFLFAHFIHSNSRVFGVAKPSE